MDDPEQRQAMATFYNGCRQNGAPDPGEFRTRVFTQDERVFAPYPEDLSGQFYPGVIAGVTSAPDAAPGDMTYAIAYDDGDRKERVPARFIIGPDEVMEIYQQATRSEGEPDKSPGYEFLLDFLAGGVSGFIAKTFTAPIEFVKLVLQNQDCDPRVLSGELPRCNGIFDCVVRTVREDGVLALWNGNTVNVLRYFPTQWINFTLTDTIKNLFPQFDPKENFWRWWGVNMFSGSLTGAVSLFFVYPFDYARTRLVTDRDKFSSMAGCIAKTGLGCYDGFAVSLAGLPMFRATYFAVNDGLVARNPYQKRTDFRGLLSKFFCAQIAALASAYTSYPFDTVRRRLQRQSELPRALRHYDGNVDCCRKIYREEGVSGFFKGALANALRVVGSALVLVMYGELKDYLVAQSEAQSEAAEIKAAEQAEKKRQEYLARRRGS